MSTTATGHESSFTPADAMPSAFAYGYVAEDSGSIDFGGSLLWEPVSPYDFSTVEDSVSMSWSKALHVVEGSDRPMDLRYFHHLSIRLAAFGTPLAINQLTQVTEADLLAFLQSQVGVVTWALMAVGLAAMGLGLRRERFARA